MRTILMSLAMIAVSQDAHAFGHKKMNVSEVKGVTETQVVGATANKMQVMVRGKGAELLYRTLKEKRKEHKESAALAMAGKEKNTHWTVQGKQVACSRIQNIKSKQEDFACAFELNNEGSVAANIEPFSPSLFNLVKTKTQAKLFPKKSGRGLASATPVVQPVAASAYTMFDAPTDKKEDTLLVFRGNAAKDIMGFLANNKSKNFMMGGVQGRKGEEISCVGAKGNESERCALVVSLADGSISTRKNPLFR